MNEKQEILYLIYNFFHKESERIYVNPSENLLYGAVFALCKDLHMDVVPYKTLVQMTGEDFSIHDIARLSHFPCRSIILEDNWYKKDCGYILAIMTAEDGTQKPVACIPARWGGYDYLEPETGIRKRIDQGTAEKISPQGYMIYKPFPNEPMTVGKIIKFGLRYLTTRDQAAYVILSIMIMLISVMLPFVTQLIYDKYIGYGEILPVVQICLVILACNIASLCFGIVRNMASLRGITSIKYAVQAAAFDRLFHLSDADIREYEAADLGNRVSGIGQIFDGMLNILFSAVLTAVCSLSYLGVTVKYSPRLTLYGILILMAGVCVMLPCIWLQSLYVKKQMEAESSAASGSYQLIEGASKLKLAGAEDRAGVEYLKLYLDSKKYYTKNQQMQQRTGILKLVISTVLGIVFYYVTAVQETNLTMGAFLGFTSAFGAFSGSVLALLDAVTATSSMLPLYKRVMPILKKLPEYENEEGFPDELTGNIEMNHVSFSYSKNAESVLKDFSFQTKPGEYIGIVGPSGCGKSTFLKLLLGFENPDQGRIYFDGKDIARLSKRELRKKMGVVLQDGKVFAGSIYENITLTAPKADYNRVMQVIKEVGLEADIAKMPMGIHTYLSEGGGTISGGQQQRILIARAILSNPKILLFDEATSALDNLTQDMVCESLEKMHTTRIVIAHRLSTIRKCDRILVMNEGRIEEEGNYEELMAKGGLFCQLASRQIF